MTAKAAIAGVVAKLHAELDGLRAKRQQLQTDLEETIGRPIPIEEVPARIEAMLAALKDEASNAYSVSFLHADSQPHELAGGFSRTSVRPLAILAAICPELVAQWITREAESHLSRLPDPMTSAGRAKAIEKIEADILAVERRECAILWEGEAAGVQMPWRSDIDGRALLGLE